MTYTPMTVTRVGSLLTVTGHPSVTFTTSGQVGYSADGVLLAENHDYLILETGDFLYY